MSHVNRSRSLVGFVAGAALMLTGVVALTAVRADAVGDDETTFVPLAACRLIDTRPLPERVGPFDTFGPGETKTVVAHGTNGKCTVPTIATGLSLNVTALHATTLTYLTFWDEGTRPKASSLNPAPGQPPTPNAVNVPLSDTGTFQVYNDVGTVNVIIDVTGYYTNAGLHELTASLPVTSSNHADEAGPLGTQFGHETVLISTPLTAPGEGKVTVIAGAHLYKQVGEVEMVNCTISDRGAYDFQFGIYPTGSFSSARVFEVSRGESATYSLVCGAGVADVSAANVFIVATYTAAP